MHVEFGNKEQFNQIVGNELNKFLRSNCENLFGGKGIIMVLFWNAYTVVAKCNKKTVRVNNWRTDKWYVKKENKKQRELEGKNLTFKFYD